MESTTNKGKPCLIFENKKFRLVYEGKVLDTWRCTIRKCPAKLSTKHGERIVNRSTFATHNHEDSVRDVQHKLKEIETTCDSYRNGMISSYDFIHALSFKFLPVTV